MSLTREGYLLGHTDWVTCIAIWSPDAPENENESEHVAPYVISGSRDKTLMIWDMTQGDPETREVGFPKKALRGHAHFVEDVRIVNRGKHAFSASWDGEVRLWDIPKGETVKRFIGHTKDVMSVAVSLDSRFVVSGSRDQSLILWNVEGKLKNTFPNAHKDWVSSVQIAPDQNDHPTLISAGWDKVVRLWELGEDCPLIKELRGHQAQINCLALPIDGSLVASGGRDGIIHVWQLTQQEGEEREEGNELLFTLDAKDNVNDLAFSPSRYWLVAACDNAIRIWDVKLQAKVCEILPEEPSTLKEDGNGSQPGTLSVAWDHHGTTLYTGHTDGKIRVWGIQSQS